MATRSRKALRKGDDANIPLPPDSDIADKDTQKADGDMSDEGKKPWEVDKAEGDDDDDGEGEGKDGKRQADGTFKAEGDDDEDDGDDDDDKAEKSRARHSKFRADLNKAISFLARHGELHDPALRKEALMAKDMKGGGLNKSERSELVGILQGATAGLQDQTARAQAPGAALRKSMVDNPAMAEAYDNITKSLHAQASWIDRTAKSLEATSYAMARALAATSDTVGAIYDRQEALGKSLDALASQPAHGPRSVGLGWVDKSFNGEGGGTPTGAGRGGRLEKASPQRLRNALQEMAKSVSASSQKANAYKMAADGLLMRRPIPPSVAADVEAHLNDTAS